MRRLVIVEDEYLIRLWISRAVDYRRLGFEVVYLAENGQDGAEAIRHFHPDVVLTDICMPVMDAFEMFEATREYAYEKIILSGFSDFEHAKKALHYGVKEFISKPIQVDELIASLVDTLAQPSPVDQAVVKGAKASLPQSVAEGLPKLPRLDKNREVSSMVLDWIHENYSRRATIGHMSEELGYSESYIYKCVKEDLGLTVNEYLNRYRIRQAVDLLSLDPEMKVYELAEAVGFSDENYFNKVFKRYLQVSVSTFKKAIDKARQKKRDE